MSIAYMCDICETTSKKKLHNITITIEQVQYDDDSEYEIIEVTKTFDLCGQCLETMKRSLPGTEK